MNDLVEPILVDTWQNLVEKLNGSRDRKGSRKKRKCFTGVASRHDFYPFYEYLEWPFGDEQEKQEKKKGKDGREKRNDDASKFVDIKL